MLEVQKQIEAIIYYRHILASDYNTIVCKNLFRVAAKLWSTTFHHIHALPGSSHAVFLTGVSRGVIHTRKSKHVKISKNLHFYRQYTHRRFVVKVILLKHLLVLGCVKFKKQRRECFFGNAASSFIILFAVFCIFLANFFFTI